MYYPELPGKKMSTRKRLPGTTRNSPKPRKCTPTHWNPNNIPETVAGGSTTRKLPGFEPLEDHGLAAYLESTDRHKKKYTSSSLRYNYPENISSANNPTITTRKSLTQVSPITRKKQVDIFLLPGMTYCILRPVSSARDNRKTKGTPRTCMNVTWPKIYN